MSQPRASAPDAGWTPHAVTVRVPATSANLGPGFDAFGLGLGLYDEHTARVTPEGLALAVHGEGAGVVPLDDGHLVVATMAATFRRLGVEPPGLDVHCHNRIPHGRGLGSSAAAIVAGVALARGLLVDGATALPDPDLLALAAELEGHPDNVAAAVLGGFTIAWESGAVRLDVHPAVRAVVFVPAVELATSRARALLPATVPHADAAFNAGRAALLVEALTHRPDLLLDATRDRLHQHYRAAAMPGSVGLVDMLRGRGIAAVISGAGPTVLALTTADQVAQARECAPAGVTALELDVDRDGLRIGGPPP